MVECAEGVFIKGDAGKLSQAVTNLIANAIRYTDEGGTITVKVSAGDIMANIMVADTGIGLTPEEAKQVFDRFWRADDSRSRDSGGLGIGLSLVKEIVQRPRPDESIRLVTESGYSFPSGHSMVSMAFYGFLLWLVWRYEKDPVVKRICMWGYAALILLVGISRIYLGVHYASDVLAGFCVSVAWLGVYTKVAVPLLIGENLDEPGELEELVEETFGE